MIGKIIPPSSCWIELYNKTHSTLINLAAVVAILQPCTVWIKELFVNPTFHFLHLPRRWSLCDSAVHLCVASSLQSILHVFPQLWLAPYVAYCCSVLRFSIILFSVIKEWTEPLSVLTPPSVSFDDWTYYLCILCKVESYSSFFFPPYRCYFLALLAVTWLPTVVPPPRNR